MTHNLGVLQLVEQAKLQMGRQNVQSMKRNIHGWPGAGYPLE